MKFILVFCSLFFSWSVLAQFHPKKIGEVTGLVCFSVWEEDTMGKVLAGSKEVIYQHNYSVSILRMKHADKISVAEMTSNVFAFVSTPKTSVKKAIEITNMFENKYGPTVAPNGYGEMQEFQNKNYVNLNEIEAVHNSAWFEITAKSSRKINLKKYNRRKSKI